MVSVITGAAPLNPESCRSHRGGGDATPTIVTISAIPGVTAPVLGETPDTTITETAQGYLIPFSAKTGTGRKLCKIGVEFDKEAKNIGRWITEEES